MQFIEANALGVRAAHYRLTSPRHSLAFLLLPMIHIGTAEYYAAVEAKLRTCDTIVFEGVKSTKARLLAASYSWAVRRKPLGLVTQRDSLNLRSLGKRLVHADSPTDEFNSSWSAIPWRERLALTFGAPLFGAWLCLTATRETLGNGLQTEDLESRDAILLADESPAITTTLVGRRDARLIAAITALLGEPGEDTTAAILYGAGHMRAATRHLIDAHAYRVTESEWVSVFAYGQ